jgi:hypothetical protein
MEHQRVFALRAQIPNLIDRIDLVMDLQDTVVDGFEERTQSMRHRGLPFFICRFDF